MKGSSTSAPDSPQANNFNIKLSRVTWVHLLFILSGSILRPSIVDFFYYRVASGLNCFMSDKRRLITKVHVIQL